MGDAYEAMDATSTPTLEQEIARLRKRESYFDKLAYWRSEAEKELAKAEPERIGLGWSENVKNLVSVLIEQRDEAQALLQRCQEANRNLVARTGLMSLTLSDDAKESPDA